MSITKVLYYAIGLTLAVVVAAGADPVYQGLAMDLSLDITLVDVRNVTNDTDWEIVDLSEYIPENAVLVYVSQRVAPASNLGDSIHGIVRQCEVEGTYRTQATDGLGGPGSASIGHAWIPVNKFNQELEWRLFSIDSGQVDYQLTLRGWIAK